LTKKKQGAQFFAECFGQAAGKTENCAPRFIRFAFRPSFFFGTGLPDGLFSNQKSQFGSILEGLEMENLGTF
jgi:hypothetical protein